MFSLILLQLSRHPRAQARLRTELRSIQAPLWDLPTSDNAPATVPDPITLKKLPYLWAVIKESIRLRGGVPSSNPRVTPSGSSITLGPFRNIPPGTRITSFSWCLHRNEAVFPQADVWMPERWLDRTSEELAEMEKWYWAFGSGSRQCLGRNVAMLITRYALAGIYTNFETSVVDDAVFNYKNDVAEPLGDKLLLKFVHLP